MLSYDNSMPVKGQDAAPPGASNRASSSAAAAVAGRAPKHHHIWLVTGPAGCGKTTVAEYLAGALDVPYIEGDSFHTEANVEKMRSGVPLTDADRWDWLTALRDESMRRLNLGSEGVVVTCSALKRKYRDVIRVAAYYDRDILVHFIFLSASPEVLLERVSQRKGHYMGANMVKSQFDILEPPARDERDVFSIDVSRSIDDVKRDALATASDIMQADL
ncbi:Gluconokinase [Purpureocillium takamizusanense]|uniref:Gluconokinase n=1 Tax=Purpureocillium takamizusanense TaxID=2060973 RepID=A0A9Q8QLT2_9HYPO|nr:Gluconokinase [Purpureocillium takamizusanense]UNI21089.1 Gluconokinase [Purpureocillium takamizusanense]